MSAQNYSTTFSVDRTPDEVFDAINNVSGWWSGNIGGETGRLGAEFTYEVPGVHRSKQKIAELVPGKKVVWRVLDSKLNSWKSRTNGMRRTLRLRSPRMVTRRKFASPTWVWCLHSNVSATARARGMRS
jgi:hypothetical protein